MKDQEFSNHLKADAKERQKMINDALNNINNYSKQIINNNKTIEQYKIDEIKYKTTIKELNNYIEIYKSKLEKLEVENESCNNEVIKLRKKILKDKTDISKFKSIIELLIKEYGISNVSSVAKIDEDKLSKMIETEDLPK